MEFKIDNETAEEEFNRFCEAWEIDNDISGLNDDEKIDFSRLKNQFITAVKKGRLCVDEENSLKYTFSEFSEKVAGNEITIKRPKGSAYMEMDRYKDNQGVHKTYAVLGAMTGREPKYFSEVDGIDLKPLQAIITLFLAG